MLRQVFATHDYTSAAGAMELSFKRGDVVVVHQEHPSNWWLGKLENGAKGLFPATFTSGASENVGQIPPRGTWYQTQKFSAMPASPGATKKIVKPPGKGATTRMPAAAAPSAPPAGEPQPPAVVITPAPPAAARVSAVATAGPPPAQAAVAAPITSGTSLAEAIAKQQEAEKAEPKRKDLTLEQARALLGKKVQVAEAPAPAAAPPSGSPKAGQKEKPASAPNSGKLKRKTTFGRKDSKTNGDGGAPVVPESKPTVGRTLRGLFGTVRAQEAPAMLQSSPRSEAEKTKKKQRAGFQEMATTRLQSRAAEKFKNQVSRIYERENLANVRQVFDGLAGSAAADDGPSTGGSSAIVEESLPSDDSFGNELVTSRAALDLCTSSPKVFLQAPESPAERMRLTRELDQFDRRTSRQLQFDDEVPEHVKPKQLQQAAAVAAAQQKEPVFRKSTSSAVVTRVRSDSMSAVPETPPPKKEAEVGFLDALRDAVLPVESEEERRIQYYGQCIVSEWCESHSLKSREWVADSMKVPVLKVPSWALVEVRDGEFHVEVGKNPPCAVEDFPMDAYRLEDVDCYRFWAKDYFLNARHAYFLCEPQEGAETKKAADGKKKGGSKFSKEKEKEVPKSVRETVLIVVRLGDEERGEPSYVMAYHRHGTARVQCSQSSTKQLEWFLRKSPFIKNLSLQGVRPYLNGPLDRHMLQWERGSVQRAFKFGVVYVANGQKAENDFYSNERGSDEFRAFLARLGNIVPLKGHTGYRAGLNVTQNLTGFLSVYNTVAFNEDGEMLYDLTTNPTLEDTDPNTLKFQIEIMFHVSTFLPFSPDNEQQLHRKRHIGNDVCVVVFKERSNSGLDESGKPKEPNESVPVGRFTSQFNHVFIVVTPWKFKGGKTTHYKVAVCSKDGVRPCRPYLPKNGILSLRKFTPWILAKLINCERGAMYAKSFSGKEARTNAAMMAEAIAITTNRSSAKKKAGEN